MSKTPTGKSRKKKQGCTSSHSLHGTNKGRGTDKDRGPHIDKEALAHSLADSQNDIAKEDIVAGINFDDFLPYLLNRIVNRHNTSLANDLKKHGVTMAYYRVLCVLAAQKAKTVSELALYTVIEQSTLSKILDRMSEADIIKREINLEDKRIVNIFLTSKGSKAFAKIRPIAQKHYEKSIAGLSDKDHKALLKTLHHILNNLRTSSFQ